MGTINGFTGEYRFLSNFWMAPIYVGGMGWASSEHAYQAAKSLNPEDWLMIQKCSSPAQAKRMGARVQMRPDWNEFRLAAMEEILEAKFDQHLNLRNKLIATGDAELIEANTWGDVFWGKCGNIGQNHLGKLLMKIRRKYNG